VNNVYSGAGSPLLYPCCPGQNSESCKTVVVVVVVAAAAAEEEEEEEDGCVALN